MVILLFIRNNILNNYETKVGYIICLVFFFKKW
jgi:hypothetical protein